MRKILLGLGAALIAVPAWAQAGADSRAQCNSDNPDVAIAGCSALIQSGQEATADLVLEYELRARAYMVKMNPQVGVPLDPTMRAEAIADLRAVLRLDPSQEVAKEGLQGLGADP